MPGASTRRRAYRPPARRSVSDLPLVIAEDSSAKIARLVQYLQEAGVSGVETGEARVSFLIPREAQVLIRDDILPADWTVHAECGPNSILRFNRAEKPPRQVELNVFGQVRLESDTPIEAISISSTDDGAAAQLVVPRIESLRCANALVAVEGVHQARLESTSRARRSTAGSGGMRTRALRGWPIPPPAEVFPPDGSRGQGVGDRVPSSNR
jgi:hypothetical protein